MSELKENEILVYLNGKRHIIVNPHNSEKLHGFIRKFYKGTKVGCESGVCGSCTVMLSHYDAESKKIVHRPVNACVMPLAACDGKSIITVEGIGNSIKLHPIQQKITELGATQCGFCTPGFVMSLYTLIRTIPKPTESDVEEFLSGNLCRCTGYRSILDAGKSFTNSTEKICPSTGKPCGCGKDSSLETKSENSSNAHECKENCDICFPREAIFPPELMKMKPRNVSLEHKDGFMWFAPKSLQELTFLKQKYPNSKVIVGSTWIKEASPIYINIQHIPEFTQCKMDKDVVSIGSAVQIATCIEYLNSLIPNLDEYKSNGLKQLVKEMKGIGSTQIRSIASIGGNLACGHSVASLPSILTCLGAQLVLVDGTGKTRISTIPDFQQKSNQEIIESISIPLTEKNQQVYSFKIAKRATFDWAVANAAFKVKIENSQVTSATMIVAGLSKICKNATHLEKFLVGKTMEESILAPSLEMIEKDFPLESIAEKADYKRSLVISFFTKFYLMITNQMVEESSLNSKGSQFVTNEDMVPHQSSVYQTTGEALYIGDMKPLEGELVCYPIISTIACGELISIDFSEALKLHGVEHIYTAKDIPGKNSIISEEFLVTKNISAIGQYLGIILAKSTQIARKALKLIKIEYKESKPILTIQEALEANSFKLHRSVTRGDMSQKADHTISGEIFIGGQDHWYMETQTAFAIPDGEDFTLWSSTQSINTTQFVVGDIINIPKHKFVVKTKRVGGSFGGKETASVQIAAAAALGAVLSKKPVRMILERDMDIMTTGQRHPFLGKWTVGYNMNGKIVSYNLDMYANGGWSYDITNMVMELAMRACDGVYHFENIKIDGYLCKTNTASNTAFRGFGSPQGLMITENMMDQVAYELKMDPMQVRSVNFYHDGDKTPDGDVMKNFSIPQMWKQIQVDADYQSRLAEIEKFNQSNKYVKRGLYMNPTKHGIGMPPMYTQAGSIVHAYLDGTVLITHGGVEMGQGLNTKVIQIASKTLGVPVEKIYINETSSDKVHNSTPTGGSIGSDLWCNTVKHACEVLNDRLAPFKMQFPALSFVELCGYAYASRLNLVAQGWYAPQMDTSFFRYFVFGVACSEVQIDTLTGQYQVLRSDVIMDLGKSLNPLIDIGQIEGAFIQGMGMFALEEFLYDNKGNIETKTQNYKIPTVKDIPKDFRVSLLKDSNPSDSVLLGSKGVGEPPLFLGATVYFAIKDALQKEKKHYLSISSPITYEKIKMIL